MPEWAPRLWLLPLVAAALVASACSSASAPTAAPPSAAPTPTPTPTPTPSPTPTLPSLLSGRTGRPNGPIMVVKFDNTAKAHPQLGLTKADVVYIEQVEGGVTRLAAVYSSELPKEVGPVRSGRISDIELLRQYGTVALIYSGSQGKLRPPLNRAALKLVSFDDSPLGYVRDPHRETPYDVIGTTSTLMRRAGRVDVPTSVGYTFGPVPSGGRPASRVTARYPGARVDAVWSPGRKRWLLSMDGRVDRAAEGGRLGPSTFIVQYVAVNPSPYKDFRGEVTPNSRTVGGGKALVFRDGRVFSAVWSRPTAARPTSYTINGVPASFASGQIWVALLGRGRPVRIG